MHVSLAIADDQSRRPLGLMGLHAWARTNAKKSRYNESGRKLTGADYAKREDRESEKWQQAVADSGARLDRKRIVHVMDREEDAYPLMSWMVDEGHAFVIRTSRDRIASAEISVGEKDHLNAVLTVAPVLTTRDVALSKRRASTTPRVTATFGERKQRSAHLELRALPVVLKRPHYLGPMEWMTVNVVHVTEKDPPAGEPAVEWTLLTSLPIETVSDVERIVDTYRIRWMIEEYFKALKTGCAIEKRQLESFDAMMKAIAIAAPVAWHLLLLRYVAHVEPKATAAKVLSPTQIAVLRAQGALKSDRPSAADALSAVASLGGHIKNNGRPGWHTLGHGYATLLLLEQGWLAAISRAKLDQ